MTGEPPLQEASQAGLLDDTLGFEIVDATPGLAHARVEVADRIRQPYGIVHGGVYSALAESLVSATTAVAVYNDGKIAVGQSNHTSFLRPISEGTVHAEATRKHRGRTSWVWEIEFSDDDGRLCAITRVTMAIREAPPSPAP